MIRRTVGAMLRGPHGRHLVSVEFSYDPTGNPLAVGMAIETASHWVEWTVGRDLLVDGTTTGGGDGDVHLELDRDGRTLWVSLANPNGQARFAFAVDDVVDFVAETTDLVPLGQERVDVDELVRQVMAS